MCSGRRSSAARQLAWVPLTAVRVSHSLPNRPRPICAAKELCMSTESFADLGVSRAVIGSLSAAGITEPFAIQRAVIGDAIAGRDVIAKSPTGSGKTLAFGIPLVERIQAEDPRPAALVLAPTRELATQIVDDIRAIAHARALRVTAVYGGVGLVKQAKDAAALAHARRDPGAPRGSARAWRVHARQRPDAGPRRGRPDARHGLSPGDRPDRRGLPAEASDAVLLGHPRRRSRATSPGATRATR